MSALLHEKEFPVPAAVQCVGVTRTYGHGNTAVQALRGVNMEVRNGELLMLVGPSGCGKTTLISVIAGVLARDGGECFVLGKDYRAMSPWRNYALSRYKCGFRLSGS